MKIDQIISVLATITLIEMMVTLGLGVTIAEVRGVIVRWNLLGRAAIANYVVVPAVTLGLLFLFRAQPMVAVGFLIPAVCPGAPYGPPFTALAKGDAALSVGLMVVLAGSSAVMAPVLLSLLLPVVAGDQRIQINVAALIGTLVATQFLPLCAGIWIRQRNPNLARAASKSMSRLSLMLNLTTLAVILTSQFRMLAEIRLVGYAGMLVLVALMLLAGWVLGGPGSSNRKALAITTSVRNVGLGLVIVSASFQGTAAVTATTALGLFQTLLMALVAMGWGRLNTKTDR